MLLLRLLRSVLTFSGNTFSVPTAMPRFSRFSRAPADFFELAFAPVRLLRILVLHCTRTRACVVLATGVFGIPDILLRVTKSRFFSGALSRDSITQMTVGFVFSYFSFWGHQQKKTTIAPGASHS